jgi:hypothetical protein
MRKININITHAHIVSFAVKLNEDKPEVEATIALLTDKGQTITTYSIATDSWREDNKFDLPVGVIAPIMALLGELEIIATRHCNRRQRSLGSGADGAKQ